MVRRSRAPCRPAGRVKASETGPNSEGGPPFPIPTAPMGPPAGAGSQDTQDHRMRCSYPFAGAWGAGALPIRLVRFPPTVCPSAGEHVPYGRLSGTPPLTNAYRQHGVPSHENIALQLWSVARRPRLYFRPPVQVNQVHEGDIVIGPERARSFLCQLLWAGHPAIFLMVFLPQIQGLCETIEGPFKSRACPGACPAFCRQAPQPVPPPAR